MKRGKQTCKILKEIRRQIAAENDIKLVVEKCTYQGDCLGTCPKCEAEVRYLERELEKRQRMGKAAVVAGLSVGLLSTSQVALAQQPDSLNMNQNNLGTLLGDVTIVEYGAIPLYPPESFPYHHVLTQEEISNVAISKLPKSGNLMVVGGYLTYPEEESLYNREWKPQPDTLFEKTKCLYAPKFEGGESVLVEFLSQNLGKNADGRSYGDMEIAFTVEPNGHLSHIDIIKGVNAPLDAQVAALFKFMEWEPAIWELNSGEKISFACQCVQKLHFPMITH
jgi:hypothetical protein